MSRHHSALRHRARAELSIRAARRVPTGDDGRLLADAISWNVILSAISGALLLFGGFVLDSLLGVAPWLLAGIGAGLLVFAGLLVWLLAQPRRLVVGAPLVVAADVAWIGGAAALLSAFPSALSATGRIVLVAVTAVVAAIAVAQLLGLRRIRSGPVSGTSPIAFRVQRILPAPAGQVWAAVSDAGDYARFAPGIAATKIVAGNGHGMVRVCTDDQGGQWVENCTLWNEGHRYRMSVDVDSYPFYYRILLHELAQTWTVDPTSDGTRITLAFDGAVKLGVIGRTAARILGNPRRLEAILDAYEHELI